MHLHLPQEPSSKSPSNHSKDPGTTLAHMEPVLPFSVNIKIRVEAEIAKYDTYHHHIEEFGCERLYGFFPGLGV